MLKGGRYTDVAAASPTLPCLIHKGRCNSTSLDGELATLMAGIGCWWDKVVTRARPPHNPITIRSQIVIEGHHKYKN